MANSEIVAQTNLLAFSTWRGGRPVEAIEFDEVSKAENRTFIDSDGNEGPLLRVERKIIYSD